MAELDGKSGVWRTVGGRRIFIRDGEDLASAMRKSGKFKSSLKKPKIGDERDEKLDNYLDKYKDKTERELRRIIHESDNEIEKMSAKKLLDDMKEEDRNIAELLSTKEKKEDFYNNRNTYWEGKGKYKDYNDSIQNLSDEELYDRGIPKGLVKEYRDEAYKYYRWFNDGDKPHKQTLDGKTYASAEYLRNINSESERNYWNTVYGNDMENRVNNILGRMQDYEEKNKVGKSSNKTFEIKQNTYFGEQSYGTWDAPDKETAMKEFYEANPQFKDGKKGHISFNEINGQERKYAHNRAYKTSYEKYMKEHPGSTLSLEDFIELKKKK